MWYIWYHLIQDDTGHNIAKVGFNGFHFWIPFLGSTPQNVAETWGFSYIAATLTGLPQLMDVPNVLRCFGLLLIGLRRASSNSNGNSLRQILDDSSNEWDDSGWIFQQIDKYWYLEELVDGLDRCNRQLGPEQPWTALTKLSTSCGLGVGWILDESKVLKCSKAI